MLVPKRVKHRKVQRGSMKGKAKGGTRLNHGEYGIQALEAHWITNRQIEAARIAMTRHMKRGGKVWITIFPDKPITSKPAETRMGSGKGNPEGFLGIQVLNTEVGTLDATVSTAGPLGAIEAKLKPEKEESEEKKPDGTAQESAQENPANRSADDYNYPDFCGRLYIPAAGIDVALYNNTSQDTCNRTDSAAIFPHRPEDGGSNIVADNELESLTSVAVGSTAYVITPGGQQINYVCVDAFNGHNDVTGYDALQKDDGTVVWGSAELIVYTCLGDAYNVRVACFNRA